MKVPDVEPLRIRLSESRIKTCAACEGYGFVVVSPAGDVKRCSCRKDVDRICALAYANVPREFWGVESKAFDGPTGPALAKARSWHLKRAAADGRGLAMVGTCGLGKTSAASLILSRAARRGYGIGYITSPDLITSEFHRDDEEFKEWRDSLLYDSHFLVLDEVGKEHRKEGSDYALSILDALLRRRRGEYKSTIVVTNLTWAKFKETYGESVWSIMADRSDVWQFNGDDRRIGG